MEWTHLYGFGTGADLLLTTSGCEQGLVKSLCPRPCRQAPTHVLCIRSPRAVHQHPKSAGVPLDANWLLPKDLGADLYQQIKTTRDEEFGHSGTEGPAVNSENIRRATQKRRNVKRWIQGGKRNKKSHWNCTRKCPRKELWATGSMKAGRGTSQHGRVLPEPYLLEVQLINCQAAETTCWGYQPAASHEWRKD